MAIRCPHCGHSMTAKDARPGKYKPKCGKCEKRFSLTISADPNAPPIVAKLEEAAPPVASVSETVISKAVGSVDDTIITPAATIAPVATAPASGNEETWKGPGGGSIDATIEPPPSATVATPTPHSRSTEATEPGLARDKTQVTPTVGTSSLNLPEVLGGYKLVRELGRGAMGAVYLAKQLSLDRNVALKVIQAQWAKNPAFVARFTREAYAAAQLTHHNVVQIYDLGAAGDINFFSMEFVSGKSLADFVKQTGKLDPEEAVGYVLQAARGLNFAHQNGMVHRDVKPANLMLNDHGIVKVADLGLVKTPQLLDEPSLTGEPAAGPAGPGSSLAAATAEVTLANVAMGTPAYMAPEQAENAAGVDHRADIYSLGCTLYVLLTGRPPFEGATALEVITKHRTEPIVRPEAIVKRVEPELSEIVLKMVAKNPDDRYQTLDEVIRALEGFMGIKSSGPFSPREEQVKVLEESLMRFNNAPLVRVRNLIPLGFVAVTSGLLVLLLLAGLASSWAWFAAGMLGAMIPAAVAGYFVISGLFDRTYLFDRVRSYLYSLRVSDWLTAAGGVLVTLLVLWLFGWLLPAMLGGVFGIGLGAAFYFVIDRPLATSRREPVEQMESLLKSLRLKGVDELALEQFVAKYSADQWEEFFERLFGYEAKLRTRDDLARTEQGRRKKKFRPWREWIVRSIDARLKAQREERDRKHLERIEEEGLKAQGMDLLQARRKAKLMAEALLDEAADVRENKFAPPAGAVNPKVAAAAKRSRQLKMLAEARSGAYESKRHRLVSMGLVTGPLGFLLSGKLRFLAGTLLLALCILWMRENGIVGQLEKVGTGDADVNDKALGVLGTFAAVFTGEQKTNPLSFFPLVNSFAPGIAGMILLLLGLFRGWKMSIFAWPAAIVAFLTPMFLTGGLTTIGYGVAAGLAVVGLMLGRQTND